jgi:hypothetical protein
MEKRRPRRLDMFPEQLLRLVPDLFEALSGRGGENLRLSPVKSST